jgi:hydrogenase small subunit
MPFMDQPSGSLLSSHAVSTYGRATNTSRKFNQDSLNNERHWRKAARKPHGSL